MRNISSGAYQKAFLELPERVQKEAMKAFRLFETDPRYPGLQYKKIGRFSGYDECWSLRIGDGYRAVCQPSSDARRWFWIGPHEAYNRLLGRKNPMGATKSSGIARRGSTVVKFDRTEIRDFKKRWPCSGIPDGPLALTIDGSGDLLSTSPAKAFSAAEPEALAALLATARTAMQGARSNPGNAEDPIAANELKLFIDNDSTLYHQQTIPIMKNLMLKRKKGVYDSKKAVQLWMYLVEAGAKKYTKDYGSPDLPWHKMFPMDTRLATARALADAFEQEAATGNMDWALRKGNPAKGSFEKFHTTAAPEFGPQRQITVTYGFDESFAMRNNQVPYFSITAKVFHPNSHDIDSFGLLHDAIAKHFPGLRPLLKWHLTDADGVPMHYFANAMYWGEQYRNQVNRGVPRAPGAPDPLEAFKRVVVADADPWESANWKFLLNHWTSSEVDREYLAKRLVMLKDRFQKDMAAAGLKIPTWRPEKRAANPAIPRRFAHLSPELAAAKTKAQEKWGLGGFAQEYRPPNQPGPLFATKRTVGYYDDQGRITMMGSSWESFDDAFDKVAPVEPRSDNPSWWTHEGGGCLLQGGGNYPCDDTYRNGTTGEEVTFRTTQEAHFSMPSRARSLAEVARIPGVAKDPKRVTRAEIVADLRDRGYKVDSLGRRRNAVDDEGPEDIADGAACCVSCKAGPAEAPWCANGACDCHARGSGCGCPSGAGNDCEDDCHCWCHGHEPERAGDSRADNPRRGPSRIRSVWDNGGETVDRYSIVLSDPRAFGIREPGMYAILGVGDSPRGFSQFGEGLEGSHLGRRIQFSDLPAVVQSHVRERISETDSRSANPGPISEEQFEKYGPYLRADGNYFEHEDVVNKPINHVWTVVEGDDGGLYASPGFHIVNKIGYLLTKKPWKSASRDATWYTPERSDNPRARFGRTYLEAYRFFKQNAGGVVGESSLGADALARAEMAVQRDIDRGRAEYEWSPDEDPDLSWCQGCESGAHARPEVGGHGLWVCVLKKDRQVVASLGGIDFGAGDNVTPSDPYKRVVEAELAAEAYHGKRLPSRRNPSRRA